MAYSCLHALPRRLACSLAASALFFAISIPAADAQQRAAQRPVQREPAASDLHWWPVRKNVWMLVGAGTNIAASVGPDGVLLVNAATRNRRRASSRPSKICKRS